MLGEGRELCDQDEDIEEEENGGRAGPKVKRARAPKEYVPNVGTANYAFLIVLYMVSSHYIVLYCIIVFCTWVCVHDCFGAVLCK